MHKPFFIFSWRLPFLPALKSFVEEKTNNSPGSALIITPNKRPWQYFAELYRQEHKAAVLPKMITFSNLITIWNSHLGKQAEYLANELDMVNVLYQCVQELAKEGDSGLAEYFSNANVVRFLPWGLRLASLLEELALNGLKGVDILYPDNSVSRPAEDLLSALGRINQKWREKLKKLNWTTPGLENYTAFENADNIPPLLQSREDRPVFIAGFYALNGVEDSIFHSLWQNGAYICLHTDADQISDYCAEHKKWRERWHASFTLITEPGTNEENKYSFFSAYDCHSQLKELKAILSNDGEERPSTAIILPYPDLLMPCMHHLPKKDINISMGYPLNRSPLIKLLDELFTLQINRSADGSYYWRDIIKVLHQPYLKMLGNDKINLRRIFGKLEFQIRMGYRFANLHEKIDELCREINLPAAEIDFLQKCIQTVIYNLEDVNTPRKMALALEDICDLFIDSGDSILQNFPLYSQALKKLLEKVIPVLKNNSISDVEFPISTLYELLRQLIDKERIPFRAFPLEGTQILGMLETRLLHFDRLIILEATDDILPGGIEQDPLLPDSLRSTLGLPDGRAKQSITAHNLFRLCAGAKKAYFFWQDGVMRSELFDSKKSRSRFVEQLIWQKEQERNNLLKPGEDPLKVAEIPRLHFLSSPRKIIKTAKILEALERFNENGASASSLEDYISCPLKFAYGQIFKISSSPEVSEGDNALLVGNIVHETLKEAMQIFLGKEMRKDDIKFERLKSIFDQKVEEKNARKILPVTSWLFLKMAAPKRFATFLEKQPDVTFIQYLEEENHMEKILQDHDRKYKIQGRVDRMDIRGGKAIILDYKTGNLPCYKKDGSSYSSKNVVFYQPGLWSDVRFFADIKRCLSSPPKQDASLEDLMEEIRHRFGPIQLPFYLALIIDDYDPGSPVYVDLADSGEEKRYFTDVEEDEIPAAMENFLLVLRFVMRHLLYYPEFCAIENNNCRYCAFQSLCKV